MRVGLRSLYPLALVLLAALIHGLIYVFVVPPWQHYDEPNHFEYSWLIANRLSLPRPGDYDQTMRREVALSMIDHGFFRGMGFLPDLNVQDQPIWIGSYTQIGDPPLYYLWEAIPMALLRGGDVTLQLYAARLASLLLFLATILAAWGVMAELTVPGSSLRWLVPATLALLPGFADLMTAVNNDVGATAVMSLFLWCGIRLMRKGFSWPVFLSAVAVATLGVLTKQNASVAMPLLVAVVLFALLRGRWRRLAWGLLGAGALASVLAVFSWGDAALWYRATFQASATREAAPGTVVGRYAFRVDVPPQAAGPRQFQLLQLIPPAVAKNLQGKTVTLGAWMWATRPIQARSPVLHVYDGNREFSQSFEIGVNPGFHAITATLTGDTTRTWVILAPVARADDAGVTLFFDGLVLAEGERPLQEQPVFDGADGGQGVWGGQPFTNLLRNPSAESSWPRFRPWIEKISARYLHSWERPSIVLYSLLDWPGAGWYYRATLANMLRTFWAKFGWGHVPLLGHKPYRVLVAVTLLGLAGAALAVWRRRRSIPWETLTLMGIASLVIWGLAVTNGAFYVIYRPFILGARYASPAFIPAILVLGVGWREILCGVGGWVRLPAKAQNAIYIALFLGLDVYALVSVANFYYPIL